MDHEDDAAARAALRPAPASGRGISITPIRGLPLFQAGQDLGAVVSEAIRAQVGPLEADDVVVFAQKVVSKVEDRTRPLAAVTPSPAAIEAAARSQKDPAVIELVLRESTEVMRVVPGVIITRHRTGHVLANAGIDASNVADGGEDRVLLWPADPDASAARLRRELEAAFGVRLAVIISDSLGRAWRMGTVGTAIGVAGMNPVRDRRGETDLFGRELQATIIGVADEIAAAASLAIGEAAEGTPVAVVRGAVFERAEDQGAAGLLRPLDKDLFR